MHDPHVHYGSDNGHSNSNSNHESSNGLDPSPPQSKEKNNNVASPPTNKNKVSPATDETTAPQISQFEVGEFIANGFMYGDPQKAIEALSAANVKIKSQTYGTAIVASTAAIGFMGGKISAKGFGAFKSFKALKNLESEINVTKGANSTLSRSGAFKEAKLKAGVPRNQHPDKVYKEKIRDQDGHVEGRVYEFKRQDGSTATIREHSLGHKLDNHSPHFNSEVQSADGIKQLLGGNGDSHTYFN